MTRFLLVLLLAIGLQVPAALDAQQGQPQRTARAGGAIAAGDADDLGPEADVFLSALKIVGDYALEPRADSLLWEMAIEGLIKELNDPYATVLSRDEVAQFEEQSTGNYAGIGIAIEELNGAVTVTTVFQDTPADRAGLLVGDRIVGVGDEVGDGWSTDDAVDRIRGPQGSSVAVWIDRDGFPQPRPFEIEREEVHIPSVRAYRVFDDLQYVVLDRVARNSAAEVDSVLSSMDEDITGIIFDLRQNPGGYLDESLNLADLFLDRGSVLVTTRSRTRGMVEVHEESARARMAPRVGDVPIVVLVDRFSASAAEIIAGALQDHDRALIVGERTFGKGLVQSVIPLPEGRLIRITSGEWFTPQGRSLNRPRDAEGRVIEPDSIPEYRSASGRVLIGGGGVFPDLEILDDTLSTAEQAFNTAAFEAEFPLQTRIEENAFQAVQRVLQSGEPTNQASISREAGNAIFGDLAEAGVQPEHLTDETRGYLQWQLERRFYQRLGEEARALEVRSERDTVLATAVRLLQSSQSQQDLFALASAENEARADAAPVGAPRTGVAPQ